MPIRNLVLLCLPIAALPSTCNAQEQQRLEFTTMVAHWDAYSDPAYLPFIEEARPEVVQVGFYGGHFWSLAHTSSFGGYPAHFPVQGLAECGAWFERLNGELHRRGAKVVGHFNLKFLVGDPDSPEGPRGFFKFYRELWDERELGAKPVSDPLDLLEKDAQGKPIVDHNYQIGGMAEYWGCLNNPHWRTVLKSWTRRAVEHGCDGLMINYFYRHNCLCDHCRRAFHEYLAARFTPAQLHDGYGIADLASHRFDEIVSWHDPAQSTPLRREMLRFSQVTNKRAFDEVFVEYGHSLKPDLIVAQWNHLGAFSQIAGDERCLLPAELWGKDEDYLWYSTGGSACFTDLAEGNLGEGTLQARYIRGAFDDKPFTLGKYEQTRIRATIAELAANGGAPMGFYTRFVDPLARQEIVRYYRFIRRYDDVFRGNRSHAEALLLFPRSRVHAGDVQALDEFKRRGRKLLDAHVLFDIRPDDAVTAEQLASYSLVARVEETQGTAADVAAAMSRFDLPATVRVSASRPARGDELAVHLVNYNREEPATKQSPGGGIADEKPIAVEGIGVDLALPGGFRAVAVELITPEAPEPEPLSFEPSDGRVRFRVPGFLVYAVARVRLEASGG